MRPFSYQDFAEQNPGSIGVEIRDSVLRPLGTIHLLRNHKRGERGRSENGNHKGEGGQETPNLD